MRQNSDTPIAHKLGLTPLKGHQDQKITTLEFVQIHKCLSNLGDSWSSLAYLDHYYYVKVGQVRLLYCRDCQCQESVFSADFTSMTSSKVPVVSFTNK